MRSAYGRVDIATPLEWLKGAPEQYKKFFLPPASTQVKNLNKHIHPAKFYGKMKNGVRTGALSSLDPRTFFPSQRAQKYFFQQYKERPLYKIYVRIIVSAKGFNDTVLHAVKKYNQSPHGLFQPIILFTASEDFGQVSNFLTQSTPLQSKSSIPEWIDESEFAIPPQEGKPVTSFQKNSHHFSLLQLMIVPKNESKQVPTVT